MGLGRHRSKAKTTTLVCCGLIVVIERTDLSAVYDYVAKYFICMG